MSGRIPASARSVLERGTICHLAARTAHGPHLTPVVFAYQRGRLWVTTSRNSVKARAWRRDPSVAGDETEGHQGGQCEQGDEHPDAHGAQAIRNERVALWSGHPHLDTSAGWMHRWSGSAAR